MKKVSILLIIAMCLTLVIAGCQPQTTTTSGTTTGTTAGTTTGTTAGTTAGTSSSNEPITMKMFLNGSGYNIEKWGQNDVSKIMMEKTGVTLELEKPAADDNQKLTLMLASNQKMPDLLLIGKNTPSFSDMVSGGKLYSLDELIEKRPSFKDLSMYQTDWEYMKYTDGKVYYIPAWWTQRGKVDMNVMILARNGYYLRKDLYEQLGSPTLKTLDDFESVLLQAKQAFPDIHPIQFWSGVGSPADTSSGLSMFYYSMGGYGPYILEGDQVKSNIRDPIFLESLKYINGLYNQGLFNESEFSDDWDTKAANNNNGLIFSAVGTLYMCNDGNGAVQKNVEGASYMPLDHLVVDGVSEVLIPADLGSGGDGINITKDCVDPDRALGLIEYLTSDEGQLLQLVGVEGKHWEWVEKDKALAQIGDYAALLKEDWNKWTDALGTYTYVWAGGNYYDSCFAWGLAGDDEVRKRVYTIESLARDYSAFSNIAPTDNDEFGVLNTKFTDMWGRYVTKMCLAEDEADCIAQYDAFIAEADALGLPKLEGFWTERYKANNG